jgi:hypothetical protein
MVLFTKWENIEHFVGAGIYKLGKDVICVYNNTEEKWNTGDEFKVMYY